MVGVKESEGTKWVQSVFERGKVVPNWARTSWRQSKYIKMCQIVILGSLPAVSLRRWLQNGTWSLFWSHRVLVRSGLRAHRVLVISDWNEAIAF